MGKLWGNMDFYVETGNFVDFLSTFWQILRFPFGLFLVFSCFFLFYYNFFHFLSSFLYNFIFAFNLFYYNFIFLHLVFRI